MPLRRLWPWSRLWVVALLLLLSAGPAGAAAAGDLQAMIDATPPGGTLAPPAGVYTGSFVIRRPLTLDGAAGVVLDAEGNGSVVVLETMGATLKNLTIRNSGHLHNNLDAGVQIRGNYNVVKDTVIENCLFGVDLKQSNNNVIRDNRISSRDLPQPQRGDAIRLWYSTENAILNNHVSDSRDMVVWYSKDNKIIGNRVVDGRYGLHFMYSQYNVVEDNYFSGSSVGIFLMYSDDIVVRGNRVERSQGASGIGIGFKETSGACIRDNKIIGNAVGIYLDVSPYQPDSHNVIADNVIGYNGIGINFHTDWTGNEIEHNRFISNFTQVAVRGGGTATRQHWHGNVWDDYAGFDRDGDGIGDTPYQVYDYADRLWMDVEAAAFFRGAPSLALLDFVERLAPFSTPKLLLTDPEPVFSGEPRATVHVADRAAPVVLNVACATQVEEGRGG